MIGSVSSSAHNQAALNNRLSRFSIVLHFDNTTLFLVIFLAIDANALRNRFSLTNVVSMACYYLTLSLLHLLMTMCNNQQNVSSQSNQSIKELVEIHIALFYAEIHLACINTN